MRRDDLEAMGTRKQGLLVRLRRETWARIVTDAVQNAPEAPERAEDGE